ncbi:hypothetical protein F8388_006321 [Cannabis sativa]|uniref:Uncharacterized protein n=1 Tax=Cannabis sativa TaxID=3483 RepID=A0A7J6EDN9_CANSA|nr:hypothetical protein F8388_006321 [Cannabis sativa]
MVDLMCPAPYNYSCYKLCLNLPSRSVDRMYPSFTLPGLEQIRKLSLEFFYKLPTQIAKSHRLFSIRICMRHAY